MNDYAGESGGGSSVPEPTVDYEATEMDTVSVKAFGDALIKDAENMFTAARDINEQLVNPVDPKDKLGQYTTLPVGADPRQESLHSIVVEHSQRMNETKMLLQNVALSLRNTGLVCRALSAQFGNQDALNGVSLDQMKTFIGDVTGESKPEAV